MQFFKKFRRNGWTALNASAGTISFAHIERRNGSKPTVTAWVSQPLDLEADGALSAFANEHSLSSHHCVALLNRSEYQLLQIDALKVPRTEVKQAVRWSIKDMLDYPVANATIDVLQIPFDTKNPSRPHFMLAIAARNEVIRECIVRYIDKASTGLKAIDIIEIGQRNIASLLEQKGRGLALLSFNDEGGLLTFTAGGELYHSRQIHITAEQLQGLDEVSRLAVYERVALDLQRTLDNFERLFSYVMVSRLLIAPFGSRAGLVNFLNSYLSLPVDTFELSDIFNLKFIAF